MLKIVKKFWKFKKKYERFKSKVTLLVIRAPFGGTDIYTGVGKSHATNLLHASIIEVTGYVILIRITQS